MIPTIKKRVILVFCDGETEKSFLKFLGKLPRYSDLISITTEFVSGGSNHQYFLKNCQKLYKQKKEQGKTKHVYCFIAFIDSDISDLSDDPTAKKKIEAGFEAMGVTCIWKDPCFEGMLLRCLPGNETRRPVLSKNALDEVKRILDNPPFETKYEKSISASGLKKIISWDDVHRASQHDADLRKLLSILDQAAGGR
ncbi:MAG: RloB domain-containing protein [Alphaproteobacteria bacterium]|nr:RloB domain-containing protein [Alphaproteobacteria bacterium]